jgi:hypothetical protein
MNISCDIFCAVVDNLGDAGVCWRLARQLGREHGWRVRLWIDDLQPLAGLRPGVDASLNSQQADGVEVRRWDDALAGAEPADVVIEAFACVLPESYVAAMAARPRAPVWLNLEYLSAEVWVSGCHGLSSPHPRLPLVKHFFFPGFTPGTGGLIREADAEFGPRQPGPALAVSMFCYENPALPALLAAWAAGPEPIVCRVASGLPRRQVEAWLDQSFPAGTEARRGALAVVALPFVPQPDYDRVLGASDLNFVRGEDSFVRAQWAERPFVWHIYPQDEGAHHDKLDAFLARYTEGLSPAAAQATAAFWRAWNGMGDAAAAWPAMRAALPALATHAGPWAGRIAAAGNLAGNLVRFCCARI